MANINPADWNYDTAAHLLLRAGFGHSGLYRKRTGEAAEVRSYANLTPEEAVDRILKFRPSKRRGPGNTDSGNTELEEQLQRWWFDRMKRGRKGLREKMVLFHHALFATAKSTVTRSIYMAVQNALFREFAVGDFRELVMRINVDPAMLWWLDGRDNTKNAPNENYGRELQELFTMGVFDFAGEHNYSQQDVVQVARMLTGWRNRTVTKRKIESYFTMSRHHTGSKTIFAPDLVETPNQDPANLHVEPSNTSDTALAESEHRRLIDAIFNHVDTEERPTVARHTVRALWKFFAYDPVVDAGTARTDLTLIDELADVFKFDPATGREYSLESVLRAMFLREEFYTDNTRTVKSPIEYFIGSLRMLRGRLTKDEKHQWVNHALTDMGQELFNPPDVFSWRGNEAWITTQTLLKRFQFARDLTQGEKKGASQIGINVNAYIDKSETTRQAVVDRFLKLLGPLQVDTATNAELVGWLGPADPIDLTDEEYVRVYVRGLVNLILTSPHYHTH